jgi:hypothetical protein
MRSVDYRLRLLVASGALAGSLAFPGVAHAVGPSPVDATAEQKKEATEHFAAGKQALEGNDFETAISELQASLQVVDSPNAHLELARALRDSGKSAEAWVEYGRAAETATRLAPKEERYLKTADAAVAERVGVEGKLALLAVSVTHAPTDATMKVGGRIVPPEEWNAPVVVSPGDMDVVLSDRGGTEITRRTVRASVGQTTQVALDGTPPAPPPDRATADTFVEDKTESGEGAQPASEAPAPQPHASGLRPFAYVVGGVGIAGLASFTVFGLLSSSAYSDLQKLCPHGCPFDKHVEIDNGITEQTVANVSLAVGLVALAAGTTMFFLSAPSASSGARAALVVAPTYQGAYLGVRGSL